MNPTQQLDYALGRLEGPARPEAEAEVAADPALRDRIDRLGDSLRLLLDDGRDFEPPPNLRARTLALVAERSQRRAILDFVPARVPFRWTDVAVAAGILVAGLLTMIPAVRQTRERMSQAGCGFNLQQIGVGLSNYAIRHNTFPDVHHTSPGTPVAAFAELLANDDLIRDRSQLRCPCGASTAGPAAPMATLTNYAYHPGYRLPSGEANPLTPRCPSTMPILADTPPLDAQLHVLAGNSPNHHARGQNVLFADLHYGFFTTRHVTEGDDDVYLNQEHLPAPGVSPSDIVLIAPSITACPAGGY